MHSGHQSRLCSLTLFARKDDIIEMATIKETGFEGQVNASDVFGVAGLS